MTRRPPADPCSAPHDYGPATFTAWQAWAAARSATHDLHTCPDCGLDAVWLPRAQAPAEHDEPGLFDLGAPT